MIHRQYWQKKILIQLWLILSSIVSVYLLTIHDEDRGLVEFLNIFIFVFSYSALYVFYRLGVNLWFSRSKYYNVYPARIVLGVILASILIVNVELILDPSWDNIRILIKSLLYLLKDIFIVLLIFVSAYGSGLRLLKFTRIRIKKKLAESLVAIGIGSALLSLFTLFLLWIKVAYFYSALLLLTILIVFTLKEINYGIRSILKYNVRIYKKKINYFNLFLGSLLLTIFLAGLISNYADIFHMRWDTLHTYLSLPKEYVLNHGLVNFSNNIHWAFPQFSEMIYTFGLLIGNARVVFLINYGFFWLFVGVIYAIYRIMNVRKKIWYLMLIFTIPMLQEFSISHLKVEILLVFYISLLLYCSIRHILKKQNPRHFYLIAIFSGVLLSIKYISVIYVAGIITGLFLFKKQKYLTKRHAKVFLMSFVIVVILISPWVVKNVIHYRNPIYPLTEGGSIYAKDWEINSQRCFREMLNDTAPQYFYRRTIFSDLSIMRNIKIFILAISNWAAFSSSNSISVGPMFLILIPWLLGGVVLLRKNRILQFLYWLIGVYIVSFIFLMTGLIWHIIGLFIVLLIVFPLVIQKINSFKLYRIILIGSILVMISSSMAFLFNDSGAMFSYIRRQTDLQRSLNLRSMSNGSAELKKKDQYFFLRMADHINDELADNKSRIYSFREARAYFINNSHEIFIQDFDGYLFHCMKNLTFQEIQQKLLDQNVEYLLYNKYRRHSQEYAKTTTIITAAEDRYIDFIKSLDLELVHNEGEIFLYKLR